MATNIHVREAADAGGVSVKALLATAGVSGTLHARIAAADADGSGVLSLAELVSVFRSEEDAVKDKRMMRRCGAVPLAAHSHPRRAAVTPTSPADAAGLPSRPWCWWSCCAPP